MPISSLAMLGTTRHILFFFPNACLVCCGFVADDTSPRSNCPKRGTTFSRARSPPQSRMRRTPTCSTRNNRFVSSLMRTLRARHSKTRPKSPDKGALAKFQFAIYAFVRLTSVNCHTYFISMNQLHTAACRSVHVFAGNARPELPRRLCAAAAGPPSNLPRQYCR